jgi:O-antigen/teichoic acid export membrane protein
MSATSRIAVAVAGAATTITVARLLGPAGSGAYAVAQTLIIMLTVATTLGVEHGIAYYVSTKRWSVRHANRDSQLVALCTGLAGAGLALLLRALVPSAFNGLSLATTAVAALALPFALSWFYGSYVALAIDRYEDYALPSALQSVAAVCLVTALGALDGVPGAVLGFTLAHVLAAATTLARNRRAFSRIGMPQTASATHALRRAIRFGIKGYASNALQFVNYRLDIFILNAIAVSATVGRYSVAVSITSVMWLLPQALSDVLFPRVAALSAGGEEGGERMRAFVETKSLRHTVIVTVLSTGALALVLMLMVVPVYGEAFRPTIDLGLIMLPGVALLGLTGPLSATTLGRGHPGVSLINSAIVTPVTIALYALLIPKMQATGAALASSISYTMTFIVTAYFYRRIVGRGALMRMLPGRSELHDYRRLVPILIARLRRVQPQTDRG